MSFANRLSYLNESINEYLERSSGVMAGHVSLQTGADFKDFGAPGTREGPIGIRPRPAVILTHVGLESVMGAEGLVASPAVVGRLVLLADARAVRVALLPTLMMMVTEEDVLRAAGRLLLLTLMLQLERCLPAAAVTSTRSGTCFDHGGGAHVQVGRRVEWPEQGGRAPDEDVPHLWRVGGRRGGLGGGIRAIRGHHPVLVVVT